MFFMVFVAVFAWMPLVSPDFFWHLKIGETILETRTLMDSEPFSHTAAGTPVTVAGWLFDVLLISVWNSTGETGIRLMGATVIALCWLSSYKTISLFEDRSYLATLLALVSLALIPVGLTPRPQLFSYLSFSIVLLVLLRVIYLKRPRELAWLIPLFAAWPNFHYAFVSGFLVVSLFVVAAVADRIQPLSSVRMTDSLLSSKAIIILPLAALATLLNPYAFSLYPDLLTMTAQASSSVVTEWRSPEFKTLHGSVILLIICAYTILLGIVRKPPSWIAVLVPIAIIAATLSSVRNAPFLSLAFGPFAALMIAHYSSGGHGTKARNSGSGLQASSRVKTLILTVAIAFAVVALGTAAGVKRYYAEKSSGYLPVDATEFLLEHVPDGQLFNQYGSGGYLIWKASPRFPVFIDGRYMPYPKAVINAYFRIFDGKIDAIQLLSKYEVEIVLVAKSAPIVTLLKMGDDYRQVYSDKQFALFVIDSPKFSHL